MTSLVVDQRSAGTTTHLGSDDEAPPSNQWASGSSGSHLERGRPRHGRARCQEMTGGGLDRMKEDLRKKGH